MTLGKDMRALAKAVLPPAVVELARRIRRTGVVWSGDYPSWPEAVATSTGYDAAVILERVQAAAMKVKLGQAAYERDGVAFDQIEYSWPLLAGLLWVAARNAGRLDVLDFGGALGTSYYQNRRFLEHLEVSWSIVDQLHFVESGRRHFEDERLRFYESVEACLAVRTPTVVMVSSVLQYLERPYQLLEQLRRFPLAVIDTTPIHAGERDRLTVQTVPPSIYPARYPCWLFSQLRLRQALERHFRIIAEFDSYREHGIRIGDTRARFCGFILERI